MTRNGLAALLALFGPWAVAGLAAQQAKPPTHKSQTWEVTVVGAMKLEKERNLRVPAGHHLLAIELTARYIGPEEDVAAPLVRIIGASGAEYKPPAGELGFNVTAEGTTEFAYQFWLTTGPWQNPDRKRLKPGVAFPGVIYGVPVPDHEPVHTLKLGFADIAPFRLTLVR